MRLCIRANICSVGYRFVSALFACLAVFMPTAYCRRSGAKYSLIGKQCFITLNVDIGGGSVVFMHGFSVKNRFLESRFILQLGTRHTVAASKPSILLLLHYSFLKL